MHEFVVRWAVLKILECGTTECVKDPDKQNEVNIFSAILSTS